MTWVAPRGAAVYSCRPLSAGVPARGAAAEMRRGLRVVLWVGHNRERRLKLMIVGSGGARPYLDSPSAQPPSWAFWDFRLSTPTRA